MGTAQTKEVPKTMRRLEIAEYNDDISKIKMKIVEVDVPKPAKGQVLVRLVSAPVNPSDYSGFREAPPGGEHLLGKEGSGVVVASGGGMSANSLVGKKVGMISLTGGTYAEYAVADATTGCFALPPDVPVEDAASFFVNPYTACGFVDTVKNMGSTGFVHTAAASQLGQMLVKLCKTQNLTIINVVRRAEQAEILKKLGAEHIIVSSEPDWKASLKAKMEELKISIIFDAIAGENTGDMMEVLPMGGTNFVYGGLSGKPCTNIHPLDLIYKKKKVEGWFLTSWIKDHGTMKTIQRIRWATGLVMPGLVNGWSASQFDDASMENMWPKFLEMWNGGGFTNKKLRIRMPVPDPDPEPEVKSTEKPKEEEPKSEEKKADEEPKEAEEKKEEETKEQEKTAEEPKEEEEAKADE